MPLLPHPVLLIQGAPIELVNVNVIRKIFYISIFKIKANIQYFCNNKRILQGMLWSKKLNSPYQEQVLQIVIGHIDSYKFCANRKILKNYIN